MNPSTPSDQETQVVDEAARWFLSARRPDFEDFEGLATWLYESPGRLAAFLDVATVDIALGHLKPEQWRTLESRIVSLQPCPAPINTPAAAQSQVSQPRPLRRRRWVRSALMTFAAAMIGIAAIGVWRFVTAPQLQTYTSTAGEIRHIELIDGSALDLNSNAEVQVAFVEERREIRLIRGEAQFTVAHDANRPFEVKAGNTLARAVGTQFTVSVLGAKHVEVVVTEGRVSVGSTAGSAVIGANTLALVQNGVVSNVQLTPAQTAERVAWAIEAISLDGVTVGEVVKVLNRRNKRQIVIADKTLERYRLGGFQSTTDPESFVMALQRLGVAKVMVVRSGGAGASVIVLMEPVP